MLAMYEKSASDKNFILNKLQNNPFLMEFFLRDDLTVEQQNDLMGTMQLVEVRLATCYLLLAACCLLRVNVL